MSKIELTISPNYVPNWTIVDAVRELFQNALDQEIEDPNNKADWSYNEDDEVLTIHNANSVLEASSLLLGQTTKLDSSATVGQFGEGYKLATLVLLRNHIDVVFYNAGAREVWRPRFVKSRRFKADILTFFIEKAPLWENVPESGLTVELVGITPDEYYNHIVPSNLHLRNDYKVLYSTEQGDILNLPGKVFVNGLYVCDYEPYAYGYNFKPECLKLDRDRKMASDFDLRWAASSMWAFCDDHEEVMRLVSEDQADVAFVGSIGFDHSWQDAAFNKFKEMYGLDALPVVRQCDLTRVPTGFHGVIVSQNWFDLILNSKDFTWPSDPSVDPLDRLQSWFDDIKWRIPDADRTTFKRLMTELRAK